jgi:hypothetical protein
MLPQHHLPVGLVWGLAVAHDDVARTFDAARHPKLQALAPPGLACMLTSGTGQPAGLAAGSGLEQLGRGRQGLLLWLVAHQHRDPLLT